MTGCHVNGKAVNGKLLTAQPLEINRNGSTVCPVTFLIPSIIGILVNPLAVQMLLDKLQGFAKPLEMYDLPLPEEFQGIVEIRVVGEVN